METLTKNGTFDVYESFDVNRITRRVVPRHHKHSFSGENKEWWINTTDNELVIPLIKIKEPVLDQRGPYEHHSGIWFVFVKLWGDVQRILVNEGMLYIPYQIIRQFESNLSQHAFLTEYHYGGPSHIEFKVTQTHWGDRPRTKVEHMFYLN